MQDKKLVRRKKIRSRIRKIVTGTAERPRLSVFRSNKSIYAQLIDDVNGHTIAAASSREGGGEGKHQGWRELCLRGQPPRRFRHFPNLWFPQPQLQVDDETRPDNNPNHWSGLQVVAPNHC